MTGLEPAASCVTGRRSNRLSYHPFGWEDVKLGSGKGKSSAEWAKSRWSFSALNTRLRKALRARGARGVIPSDRLALLSQIGSKASPTNAMPLVHDPSQLELWAEAARGDGLEAAAFADFRRGRAGEVGAGLSRAKALDPGFARRRPMRILVADDNEINRKVVRVILQKLGYGCEEAANGEEAFARQASEPFDAIFMDIDMPEMDGVEASEAIRALEESERAEAARAKAEIIAVTANVGEETRRRCRRAGMNAFLEKPITAEVVKAQLLRSWPRVRSQRVRAQPAPLEFQWD